MKNLLFAVSAMIIGCGGGGSVAPAPADMAQTPVQRGAYLVEHVSACGDCHTPRGADGQPDRSRWLGGVANEWDLDPSNPDSGGISAPNLTPHATGLMAWSDDEIKNAMLNGIDKDGNGLFILMPYYVLHNMSPDDADAIVAYLRSIDPVDNAVPARQSLPVALPTSAPLDETLIPHTTLAASDPNFARAEHGRYLAGALGACVDCHTPMAFGRTLIDDRNLFAGNKEFDTALLGLPSPPLPAAIYSANITPAANGIAGWTPQQVADAIKLGVENHGASLCPPMPFGPTGGFGGMTDDDALDIGLYLTSIPPIDNGVVPLCTVQ